MKTALALVVVSIVLASCASGTTKPAKFNVTAPSSEIESGTTSVRDSTRSITMTPMPKPDRVYLVPPLTVPIHPNAPQKEPTPCDK